MAVTFGNTGDVTLGTNADFKAHIFHWTARIEKEEVDSRTFATDDHGKTTAMGMNTITGTIEGFVDALNWPVSTNTLGTAARMTPTAGTTPAVLTLTSVTGRTMAFDAHLSDVSFTTNKQTGLNSFTASFVSTRVASSLTFA